MSRGWSLIRRVLKRLAAPWFPQPLSHLRVVLYTRPGCHLCERAEAVLDSARLRYRFTLTVTDIAADPGLEASLGDQIPVVTIDQKVRFRGGVKSALLERLLRAEFASRQRPGSGS